ncbi:MAG: hypothetical protein ABR880_20620 [Candidatus Sulfotelmatobacter sp.]
MATKSLKESLKAARKNTSTQGLAKVSQLDHDGGQVKGGNSDPHPIHNSQNSAWFSGTWAVSISL